MIEQKSWHIRDRKNWEALKNSNKKGFNSLLKDNYTILYNFSYKICKSKSISEDCIQDLFIYLWENKNKLESVAFVRSYLLKSIKRRVLRELKVQQQNIERSNFWQLNRTLDAEEPHIEQKIIEKESIDSKTHSIHIQLEKLSDRQKEALDLKYFCGLSYKEIAEIMEINEQSVANVLRRAIVALKEGFQP